MARYEYTPTWTYPSQPSSSSYTAPPMTPPMMPYDGVAVREACSDDYGYPSHVDLGADVGAGIPHQLAHSFLAPDTAHGVKLEQGVKLEPGYEPVELEPGLYDTSPAGPSYKGHYAGYEPDVKPFDVKPADVKPRKVKVDMNMAENGSTAAMAGINTPLAQYAAQMAVWIWYGDNSVAPARSPTSSPLGRNPFDSHPSAPLNPLQVAPTPAFTQFVEHLLRITTVSHSVTLIALLYLYRLKSRNQIVARMGTETRPFIASLILSNKYLDDNTYTNKTWAELTKLPVVDINRMEQEFLRGLDFSLSVDHSDYKAWRDMLDGFIFAREVESSHRRYGPPLGTLPSPISNTVSPHTSYVPSQAYMDVAPRARSASPPGMDPPFYRSNAEYAHAHALALSHSRKRSAIDAFSHEPSAAGLYEHLRLPARKSQLNIAAPSLQAQSDAALGMSRSTYGTPTPSAQSESQSVTQNQSGLARSSSLNRRIARMPQGLRRGSVGHVFDGLSLGHEDDLRHTATQHAAALHMQAEREYARQGEYGSLVAPYDQGAPQAIPPEHLVFYTLAATPHPGQDGAPRKAILRHQVAHPYSYPPHHPAYQGAVAAPSFEEEYGLDDAMDGADYGALHPASLVSGVGAGMDYGVNAAFAYNSSPLVPTPTGPNTSHPLGSGGYASGMATPVYPTEMTVPPFGYPGAYHAPAESLPGHFANAGPAGYLYDPHSFPHAHSNAFGQAQYELSQGHGPDGTLGVAHGLGHGHGHGHGHAHGMQSAAYGGLEGQGEWYSRSEWSSPVRTARW